MVLEFLLLFLLDISFQRKHLSIYEQQEREKAWLPVALDPN